MTDSVVAIIPAYNEEERIETTVRSLLATQRVGRVLVVDDGSTDGTADRAQQAGATVLRLPQNQGKSTALAEGVRASTEHVLLFVDADLKETAGLATELLGPILAGTADMAIAAWPRAGKGGGFGLVRRLSAWLIRVATGQRMDSPLSGQRALTRAVWQSWRGSRGYGFEVALTIDALHAGFKVVELPLPLTHRSLGRSLRGFLHRGRQLCHIVLTVARRCLPW